MAASVRRNGPQSINRMGAVLERWIGRRARLPPLFGLACGCVVMACAGATEDEAANRSGGGPVQAWVADTLSRLEIGREGDGATRFGSVRGALMFQDGRMAIADGTTRTITVLSRDGVSLRTLGGRGAGPGEFNHIGSLARIDGHHGVLWDRVLGRATVFSADSLEGTSRPDLPSLQGLFPRFVGVFSEHELVFQDSRPLKDFRDHPDGLVQDTVSFVGVGDGGTTVLGEALGSPRYLTHEGSMWGWEPLIFAGGLLSGAGGQRLVLARSDSLAIRVIARDGDVLKETYGAARSDRPTARQVERERRRRLDAAAARQGYTIRDGSVSISTLEVSMQRIREVPAARRIPMFTDLILAGDGRIWLRRFDERADGVSRYAIFTPDLELEATLSLPSRFQLLDADRERLLLLTHGVLDEDIVVAMSYGPESESQEP